MAQRTPPKSSGSTKKSPSRVPAAPRSRWPLYLVAMGVALLVGLYWVYQSANRPDVTGGTARSDYQVGSPGAGQQAPAFTLPSTQSGNVSLTDYRGKTVLLYFHEGLGCQPCWDQIRDLEKSSAQLKTAGVDAVVAITTGPVDLIAQKAKDDSLSSVNLADPDLAVSHAYNANKYGMMGDSRDGHSFLLVGPDGTIRWRADYGGAPNYTMYVPVQQLLTDLKTGTNR